LTNDLRLGILTPWHENRGFNFREPFITSSHEAINGKESLGAAPITRNTFKF
jgi:hypothetical protein